MDQVLCHVLGTNKGETWFDYHWVRNVKIFMFAPQSEF